MFSYDSRFAHCFGICFFEGEEAGGGSGDGGGSGGQGSNGNQNGGQGSSNAPEWASEFGDKFDPERAWNALKAARDGERTFKQKHSEAASKLKQYEDEGKSPFEKLQGENEELKRRVQDFEQKEREASLRSQVAEAARKLGAHYPEDMFALVQNNLDVGSDGKVRNADAVLKELKESRPAHFQEAKRPGERLRSGASSGDRDHVTGDINAAMRAAAGR